MILRMTIVKNMVRAVVWIPAIIWSASIFWLSSQSDIPEPDFWLPPFFDKLVHAFIYAILACLLYPAFRMLHVTPWTAACLSILLASLYGITDEWHQSLVANRSPDVFDWVADSIGACFVIAMARYELTKLATTNGHE